MQLKKGWIYIASIGALTSEIRPVFSRSAEGKVHRAVKLLEQEFSKQFNGTAWLRQQGFTNISIIVEVRSPRRERKQRTVVADGSVLVVEISHVYPRLEEDTEAEVVAELRPVVLEALRIAAERKELGPLPPQGEGDDLPYVAERAPAPELPFYYEEPGDCYVVIRQLPQTDDPEEIAAAIDRYETDIKGILSEEVLRAGIDAETTASEVRWLIPVQHGDN